jgi:hypothetical protein
LCPDLIQEFHAGTTGREIPLDLGIPREALTPGKPIQEGLLLFNGQSLDFVLDVRKFHHFIVLGAGLPQPKSSERIQRHAGGLRRLCFGLAFIGPRRYRDRLIDQAIVNPEVAEINIKVCRPRQGTLNQGFR